MGRLLFDAQYVKNAAGVYVKAEPIDASLVASASTDQVVAKKSDGTLYLKTVSGGGSGALTLLDTQTPSNAASVTMVTGISNTYDEYELRFAIIPVSDNVGLRMRLSSNTGSSWDSGSTDYRYRYGRQRDGSSSAFDVVNGSAGQAYIELAANIGSDTGEGIQGVIRSASLRSTTLRKMVQWDVANMSDVGEVAWQHGSGARVSASQFDGIQLYFSTGNVESGWARLYGYAKS